MKTFWLPNVQRQKLKKQCFVFGFRGKAQASEFQNKNATEMSHLHQAPLEREGGGNLDSNLANRMKTIIYLFFFSLFWLSLRPYTVRTLWARGQHYFLRNKSQKDSAWSIPWIPRGSLFQLPWFIPFSWWIKINLCYVKYSSNLQENCTSLCTECWLKIHSVKASRKSRHQATSIC